MDTFKKDCGLWAVICMVRKYGDTQVETMRSKDKGQPKPRAATRPLDAAPEWDELRGWIVSYTPSRLCRSTVGFSQWMSDAADAVRNDAPMFAIYRVWSRLLAEIDASLPSHQILDCAKAMAGQATWATPENLDSAVAAKIKRLSKSAFSAQAVTDIEALWKGHVRADNPDGIGRFIGFHLGWNAFESKLAQPMLLEFLLALKRINSGSTSAPQCIVLAEALAENETMPFESIPRFSECLALSRPEVFPFVNDWQIAVVADLTNQDLETELVTRRDYMRILPMLQKAMSLLKLTHADQFDLLLQRLAELKKGMGRAAYWGEVNRFRASVR